MRNIIILTLLMVFATASFAQQPVQKQSPTQADYLRKSKKQNTAAWIFTVVGTTGLFLTFVAESSAQKLTVGLGETSDIIYPCVIAACLATGIVFFVASDMSRKKAKEVSAFINMERAPVLQAAVIHNQFFPVAGVRISL